MPLPIEIIVERKVALAFEPRRDRQVAQGRKEVTTPA
jgi:hypothetical protein